MNQTFLWTYEYFTLKHPLIFLQKQLHKSETPKAWLAFYTKLYRTNPEPQHYSTCETTLRTLLHINSARFYQNDATKGSYKTRHPRKTVSIAGQRRPPPTPSKDAAIKYPPFKTSEEAIKRRPARDLRFNDDAVRASDAHQCCQHQNPKICKAVAQTSHKRRRVWKVGLFVLESIPDTLWFRATANSISKLNSKMATAMKNYFSPILLLYYAINFWFYSLFEQSRP